MAATGQARFSTGCPKGLSVNCLSLRQVFHGLWITPEQLIRRVVHSGGG